MILKIWEKKKNTKILQRIIKVEHVQPETNLVAITSAVLKILAYWTGTTLEIFV